MMRRSIVLASLLVAGCSGADFMVLEEPGADVATDGDELDAGDTGTQPELDAGADALEDLAVDSVTRPETSTKPDTGTAEIAADTKPSSDTGSSLETGPADVGDSAPPPDVAIDVKADASEDGPACSTFPGDPCSAAKPCCASAGLHCSGGGGPDGTEGYCKSGG